MSFLVRVTLAYYQINLYNLIINYSCSHMRNQSDRYLDTLKQNFAVAPNFNALEARAWQPSDTVTPGASLVTTNQAAQSTAFQRWFHFKEAFSPEFVTSAIHTLGFKPAHVIDPFGGSGTTAITCQLLDINVTTIEINPFLSDVIASKLAVLGAEQLLQEAVLFLLRLDVAPINLDLLAYLPLTFVEDDAKDRWIFPKVVAERIAQYLQCITMIESQEVRQFFRIVLGSVLVDCSNVYVNGKGRRYRKTWRENQRTPADLDAAYRRCFDLAFEDVQRFEQRPRPRTTLLQGDSRTMLAQVNELADLIVFSPPYPNSFDYTDIYNVELWTLGYLTSRVHNSDLRLATLHSHVQIGRDFGKPEFDSPTLKKVVTALEMVKSTLWDHRIPLMVHGYFRDLEQVMAQCARLVTRRGKVMMVVGDSRYAGVLIDVPQILRELAIGLGFKRTQVYEVRKMRASAQQGGSHHLRECIVELGL